MAYYQNRDDTERKVLEIILQNNYITKTIASENNISEYKFRKSIKKLIDEKIITKKGKGRSVIYELKITEEAFIQKTKQLLVNINEEIKKL